MNETTAPGSVDESQQIHDSEAEYALEYPAVCPWCNRDLKAVCVIRLLRTRVNFTSTLPRRGVASGEAEQRVRVRHPG